MQKNEFETEVRRQRPRWFTEACCYTSNADDAEDVVQEVVLKLWTLRDRLEQYRSIEALGVVMTRRLCLDQKRKRTLWSISKQRQDPPDNATPETTMIDREEEERIVRQMKTLPDAQQTVLRMKHIDGLEVAEIARITGSSEEAVRANLSRARRKIMQRFNIEH